MLLQEETEKRRVEESAELLAEVNSDLAIGVPPFVRKRQSIALDRAGFILRGGLIGSGAG